MFQQTTKYSTQMTNIMLRSFDFEIKINQIIEKKITNLFKIYTCKTIRDKNKKEWTNKSQRKKK